MKPSLYAELALLVTVCVCGPNSMGQDVRKLSIISKAEYVDEQADLHLGASNISPVNGNVFQAVVVKSDDEESPYRFYIWELSMEGEKLNEWLIDERSSITIPVPSYLVPCLHVLPSGEIVTVIVDEPRIPSLAKFDARGNILFRKPSIEHRKEYPHFMRIMPAGGGQVFVLGGLRGRPMIWKVDEQGEFLFEKEIVFEKEIGVDGAVFCSDGVQLPDGTLRICGVSRNGDVVKSWVVDVDSQGQVKGTVLFDNAPWPSLSKNVRIAHLATGHTAFLHPVTVEGKTYCNVTVLDEALRRIAEIKLCEVPDYVGAFEVQRQNKDLVIAVVDSRPALSLYVLDENLKVRAKGDAQDLLPGSPLAFKLAASQGRALVLAQRGVPIVKKSNAIGCAVFSLEDPRGQARP